MGRQSPNDQDTGVLKPLTKFSHSGDLDTIWRFPKSWGYPQIIQVMDDHFFSETHGFVGDPP